MRQIFAALVSVFLLVPAAWAQGSAQVDALFRALSLEDLLEIMRDEGLDYGREMQAGLLAGRGGERWVGQVGQIYDVATMSDMLRARLERDLAEEDLEPMLAFFTSDRGQRIITLEVSARAAFLDEEIEDMSKAVFADLEREGATRAEMIKELVSSADLIDSNVVGALNANVAFYEGLADGGALPGQLSDDDVLADVWAREPEIRRDTTEWLHSYLNLAYQPLSDEDLSAYIDFYVSAPGQVLNEAIFAAFDEVFSDVSFRLGKSASAFLAGEEL